MPEGMGAEICTEARLVSNHTRSSCPWPTQVRVSDRPTHATVSRMRSWILPISLALSLSTAVQAKGLVGWPASFKNSGFCKTYGCTGAATRSNDGWGGSAVTYRVSKLANATLLVSSASDGDIVTAVLKFNGRVFNQLTTAEFRAAEIFFQAATGRKVSFTAAECWKSGQPNRAPRIVNDGEGHSYNINCTSVQSTDISKEQAAELRITPKTLTGFAVEPRY